MPDPIQPRPVADVTLHGRAAEVRRLDRHVRDGRGALVLRGAAGVGKTALLRHAVAGARGMRVVAVCPSGPRPYAALSDLCAALGQAPPEDSGPFTIGVAMTQLLSAAAPLLCVVDDAQCVDAPSARALAFASRRLRGRVVLLFAERTPTGVLDALPELAVPPLCRAGARALVRSLAPGLVNEAVVERFVAETGGNPGAILRGDAGRPAATLRARVRRLDTAGRTLLLAAAEPTGDVALLWRAAARLGVAAAELQGLLEFGELVMFPDPALRAWVYHAATVAQRRRVHRALAEVTDTDRRAWHHAHATPGPVAADGLVAQVARARARGGPGEAAAFLRLAAALTTTPGPHTDRTLAAASAELDAGRPAAALRLLETVDAHQPEAVRLRAWLTFTTTRTPAAAEALLLTTRAAPSSRACSDALGAAILTGVAPGAACGSADTPVTGLLAREAEGFAQLRSALAPTRSSWLAGFAAAELWDDRAWHRVTLGTADPVALPDFLTGRALFALHTGDFAGATALDDEAAALSLKLGQAPLTHVRVLIAAWRGRAAGRASGAGLTRSCADLADAVAANAVGDHRRALAAAQRAVDCAAPATTGWALTELVEAAVGAERTDIAARALDRLVDRTDRCGTDWALGAQARARARLCRDRTAGELYTEAIVRHSRTRLRPLLARTRLDHGEWLCRQGRHSEASELLRAAHDAFARIGATAFAARSRPSRAGPLDLPGDRSRGVGPRRPHQCRDRCRVVDQPTHSRVPPAQGLREARPHLEDGTPPPFRKRTGGPVKRIGGTTPPEHESEAAR